MVQWRERSPSTNAPQVRCRPGVEFVVGSHVVKRFFFQVLWFSSLHKNKHFKFKFNQDRGPASKPAKADVASSLDIVI